jgi:hypothetical protein
LRDTVDPEEGWLPPENWSLYEVALEELRDAGEYGEPYFAVKNEVDGIVDKHSLPLKDGDSGHKLLSHEVLMMMFKYYGAIEKRAGGNYSQDIDA